MRDGDGVAPKRDPERRAQIQRRPLYRLDQDPPPERGALQGAGEACRVEPLVGVATDPLARCAPLIKGAEYFVYMLQAFCRARWLGRTNLGLALSLQSHRSHPCHAARCRKPTTKPFRVS